MKLQRSKAQILFLAAAMLLTGQLTPSVAATQSPTFFNYQIKDGVIVDGKATTIVPLGKAYAFRYSTDNVGQSGPGKLIFSLYSNGTLVWKQTLPVTTNGTFTRNVPAPVFTKQSGKYGPFYLCATEQLNSGAAEPKAPCSKWLWIAIEVPIAYVSNGCGGMTGIKFIDSAETKLLDTRTFQGIVVPFKPACDIHDAAYSGVTVKDSFLKNKVVNYLRWTRKLVDSQFQMELQQTCVNYLASSAQTNPQVAIAMQDCFKWATRYYTAVRAVGHLFYDINPVERGTQGLYIEGPNLGRPYGFGVVRDIR